MKNITFGRYSPYNTFIHKLDPRNKLLLAILFIVGIFFQFKMDSTNLIMSGIYLVLVLLLMLIAHVSFVDLFRQLKGMWFLILFLLIVYIFVPNISGGTVVAFYIGNYPIYWKSFSMALYIVIRLILMLSIMMILTSTTKPMDLTYGFEWYMTPLKVVKFPSHEIAMTLSIALRFIPTLLDETQRIIKAQSSRGVDFNHGGLGKRFKAIISLIIPLFVSAIDRSEELSNAMEVRGYDPKSPRTRYRRLHFIARDLISFIAVVLVFAGIVALYVYDKQSTFDILKVLFGIEGVIL